MYTTGQTFGSNFKFLITMPFLKANMSDHC